MPVIGGDKKKSEIPNFIIAYLSRMIAKNVFLYIQRILEGLFILSNIEFGQSFAVLGMPKWTQFLAKICLAIG